MVIVDFFIVIKFLKPYFYNCAKIYNCSHFTWTLCMTSSADFLNVNYCHFGDINLLVGLHHQRVMRAPVASFKSSHWVYYYFWLNVFIFSKMLYLHLNLCFITTFIIKKDNLIIVVNINNISCCKCSYIK